MGNISAPMPPMLPAQSGGTSFPARLAPLAGSQSVPLALPAGARVVAEVVQTQTDGQVLLRLGQTLLAAQLPGQHQVGDQLPLIVLSEPGAQPALLMAPQLGTPASQPELSTTGQWLARLQQQAAPALRAPEPLWPQPDGSASPRLAQALASSVRESGLFYESHLAAWVQGELPTEALLQEPQGRLSTLAPTPPTDPGAGAAPGGTALPPGAAPAPAAPAPTGASADAQVAPTHDAQAAAPGRGVQDAASPRALAAGEQPVAASGAPGGGAASAPPPHPHAAVGLYASVQVQTGNSAAAFNGAGAQAMPAQLQALVQQQLATLAQGAVVWAGQAWPGQDLEWRIEQDDARASQGDAAAPARAWTSVLRLDLPRLGQLVVTLRLSALADAAAGQHLRVRVEHASGAAEALHARGSEFRQALRDAGLQLDELALRPLGGEQHA